MARPEPHRPISPPPATGTLAEDLPAYVSNGVIGLRVRDVALVPGMAIVSGFVGEHHGRHVEAAVAEPYPLGGDIALSGVWASEITGGFEPVNQLRLRDCRIDHAVSRAASGRRGRGRDRYLRQPLASDRGLPGSPGHLDQACELTFRPRVDPTGVRGSMAERRLDTPGEAGFGTLRRLNREAWADLWKGRIRLGGAGER